MALDHLFIIQTTVLTALILIGLRFWVYLIEKFSYAYSHKIVLLIGLFFGFVLFFTSYLLPEIIRGLS